MSFGVLGEYAKILCIFSMYAEILSAHSPNTFKYFPRILHVRRKNEEYAERIFHHQQCLGTSKGKGFEKIECGVICLPRMNSLQKICLVIYKTKTALCVYGDYAKWRNKY